MIMRRSPNRPTISAPITSYTKCKANKYRSGEGVLGRGGGRKKKNYFFAPKGFEPMYMELSRRRCSPSMCNSVIVRVQKVIVN